MYIGLRRGVLGVPGVVRVGGAKRCQKQKTGTDKAGVLHINGGVDRTGWPFLRSYRISSISTMPTSMRMGVTTVGRRRQIVAAITTAIASIQRSGAFVVPSALSTATAASVLSAGRAHQAHGHGLTMSSPVGPEERVVIIGGGIGEAPGRFSRW